ncbi:MAG TPA: 16S rRNA (uracil(1498)-N(3))-methyltransferase [Steroidobacteraceae bacterium]|nr:16S rRNA (uracil(1498)-N(3))-methyltransferase [Steroidobacteraceae bacterium]
MRLTRVYVEGPLAAGAEIELPAAGAYHVGRVLRLRPGAPLIVFDGSGGDWHAEIVTVTGHSVVVQLESRVPGTSESPLRITLIQGLSRSERMDWTLQKAVELGVAAIAPVLTVRSVVRLDEKQAARKVEHWRGIVIAACEQCGRNRIPEVRAPVPLEKYLSETRREGGRYVLAPGAPIALAGLASVPGKIELLVGPEGGLDDAEVAAAQQAGFTAVRLGPRTLRTETASVVALTVLQAMWGDLQ